MGITENHLTAFKRKRGGLLEYILSPANLNLAYKQVKSNKGGGGVDKMEVDELLACLQIHKNRLIQSIYDDKYHPNPVRRVEIPKTNGKKQSLGIRSCFHITLIIVYCRNVFTGTNIRIDSNFLIEY